MKNSEEMKQFMSIMRLTRADRNEAKNLTRGELRHLVDNYYIFQEMRKRIANQIRAMEDEPHLLLERQLEVFSFAELQTKSYLDRYTKEHPIGKWMRSIRGIGPVIAAGLIAHLDIRKAKTAGAFWKFAGLDPMSKWNKGEKRPWNASLKRLCFILGECFVKTKNHEEAFYGKIYEKRREYEDAKNESGEYADQAAEGAKRVGKTTESYKAYEQGKLPKGHLQMRCMRYTVKLFLSHLHGIWYEHEFGEKPPIPYPIAHLNHVHMIDPPNAHKEEKAI